MAWVGSAFLRILQTLVYAILFGCSGIILGSYSFFLAALANQNLPIATWKKAVEGISGVAVAYLILAIILTCCLGGIRLFAFIAIILDVLFAAGFIAIAVLTRNGTQSCSGNVNTPIGNGPANSNAVNYGNDNFGFGNGNNNNNNNYSPNLRLACRLNKVSFAVAIIGAVLFLIAAGLQLAIARKHQKDKRYGPSPENGYAVSGKQHFWQRKRNSTRSYDTEAGKVSHDTGYTGSPTAPVAPATVTYDAAGRPVNPAYGASPYMTSANY